MLLHMWAHPPLFVAHSFTSGAVEKVTHTMMSVEFSYKVLSEGQALPSKRSSFLTDKEECVFYLTPTTSCIFLTSTHKRGVVKALWAVLNVRGM